MVDATSSAAPAPRPRRNPFTDARTRVLAIASGKGGVGKSSVTTNLSIALAQRGHRVAVVDADVWGFSMPRMLGVARPPDLIDDVIVPPDAHGVRLISMGFFAREDQAVVWRGPMLHKALEQFLTDVHWGEPDYLVIDLPPGTGDVSLSIAQFLPRAEVLVVTTPQPAAQKVAQRAARDGREGRARRHRRRREHVVVPRRRRQALRALRLRRRSGARRHDSVSRCSARCRSCPELREGGDAGEPIVVESPDDEASVSSATIAERIDTELVPTQACAPGAAHRPRL